MKSRVLSLALLVRREGWDKSAFYFLRHSFIFFPPFPSRAAFPSALAVTKSLLSVSLTFSQPFIRKQADGIQNSRLAKQLWQLQKKKKKNFPLSAHYSACVSDELSWFWFFFLFVFFFVEIDCWQPTEATVGLVLREGLIGNLTHCSGRHS